MSPLEMDCLRILERAGDCERHAMMRRGAVAPKWIGLNRIELEIGGRAVWVRPWVLGRADAQHRAAWGAASNRAIGHGTL